MEEKDREQSRSQGERPTFGANLMKNLGVASALVICAAALRSGALPPLTGLTDTVLDAMSADTLLDEQLGRLTFVGSFFPEAELVFGEQTDEPAVMTLASSDVVHGWSEAEPYLAWNGKAGAFAAPSAGEVSCIRREPDGRWAVTLDVGNVCCVFGGLSSLSVGEGDRIAAGEPLGQLDHAGPLFLEVCSDGRSVWPEHLVRVTP